MTESIFRFDKLKPFDKWTIALYLILTLGLVYYFNSTENIASKRNVIFMYPFITQLALYGLNYKSLRNLTVFFAWVAIGLLHLYFYFSLKDDKTLQMFRGHSTASLKNTISLLCLHQAFRLVSIKIQGKELVSPSKGFNNATDIYDNRNITTTDYVLFFTYIGCAIILAMN